MSMIAGLLLVISMNVGASEVSIMSGTIQDVKKKHVEQLMAIEGVRSIGIGKNQHGEVAIIIGLDRPLTEISAQLPENLDGYPVVTQAVGDIKAQ